MGSSGMRRRGRGHLPKVGSRAEMEHELHDRREVAMHPFDADPLNRRRSRFGWISAAVIALLVAIGVVAVVVAT